MNAKDTETEVTKCLSCGSIILQNFTVSFATYEAGNANYVDPSATNYHRKCWRILKRAERGRMTELSTVPTWDALRSWFAWEEVASWNKAAQDDTEESVPATRIKEKPTEDGERRKENAAVFALADKDWQDAGWGAASD